MREREVMLMQPGRGPVLVGRVRGRWVIAAMVAALLASVGCDVARPRWLGGGASPDKPGSEQIADADTAFTLLPAAPPADQQPQRPVHSATVLSVLHVQIPHERRAAAEKVWNHLREDLLDSELALRLRRNGLRVGFGQAQWWDAIKAALDAIEGHRVSYMDAVRLPPGFPLGLELDTEPRDQTLFLIEPDGILSGDTWPQSRNVLLVTCGPDLQQAELVHLFVYPEVRQRLPGWRWVRTEAGLWQTPKQSGRIFRAAGFSVTLGSGEFMLLAPSADAEVFGLIGGAFLIGEEDGRRYDSYVFLRPELTHVDRPG
jgi:hypothetical protein